MKQLFGKTFEIMERALDLRIKRNAVITANLANVDTPGYKGRDLPFREIMAQYLREASEPSGLRRTEPGHLDQHGVAGLPPAAGAPQGSGRPLPSGTRDALTRTDARHYGLGEDVSSLAVAAAFPHPAERGTPNAIDLDQEMARLATNNLQYQATVQALIKEIEVLKTAITEGGKS